MFETFSLIFLIAALLSVVNYKFLKLPSTIGTMILALVTTGLIILFKPVLPDLYTSFCGLIEGADFRSLLLDMMLSALLFAGAIHINVRELKKEGVPILLFSTLGVLISTALVGGLFYSIAPFFGLEIPFIYALLFGALVSPTDPIAVLAILQKTNISKSLELKIEGESLFNDGVGVVVFTGVLLVAESMGNKSAEHLAAEIGHVFLVEAVGGLAFGLVLGWLTLQLLRWIQENRQLSVIITLAAVFGGYSIAQSLGTSGPLAMVVAGLFIGNGIYHEQFNAGPKEMISKFWEVLDESLNTILFVLIGMSLHLLAPTWNLIGLGTVMIFVVLFSRAVSIFLPYSIFNYKDHDFIQTCSVLTWGGLRGGISIALALSLPDEFFGKEILMVCFIVVLFSILVQGLTIEKLIKWLF